ncbi:hypothetical protein [Rahnella variigena]|uniref:Lipoprotein n=1 Tax=Rahnella variigena TaxID=574964 RepID=A0ABX9PQS6_9GAMM|nr:hypothetical protein [Rahnella variigena]RJT53579.1 hypothetical protein D6D38_11160 [Rahnella variigena]RKF66274.1 hypothetical protein CKQ54_23015 [Rahnella variigena]
MSYRFTLAAAAAVIALTGCAKTKTADQAPAFDFGSTRLTVAHVPTKTDDGTKLYVTIDDKEAGALGTGESMEVQLPEGKHKVGGYARSLIGRVTIAPVEVATSRDAVSHVTYSVANLKPTFLVRASTPVPKPKSESIPAEPVPSLPKDIEAPAVAEQSQASATPADAPAATAVVTQQTSATSATSTTSASATPAAVATQPVQTATPATPAATQQTQTAAPAPQTPAVTDLTPTTQSQTSQATQSSTTPEVTDLTSAPQA